jgi:SAM-dependent methyltransferase
VVAEHCRLMSGMNAAVAPDRRAFPVCTSVSGIGLRSETFDAVFATGSASHFPDMARALAESYRVLRPGGVLTFIEEVSLLRGEPSQRFRQLHPEDVFAVSSWPQRQAQLRDCGFDSIEWTDLGDWAATQLKHRLLAMRIYRKKIDECYGPRRAQEIFDTLTAAQGEFAAGTVMPVHVTAHRPMP